MNKLFEKNKSAVILSPERSEWVSRSHVTSVEPVVNDGAKTQCYSAKRDLYGDFAYAQPLKMTNKALSFLRLRGASGAQGISAPALCREAHKRRFILNPWILRFANASLRMTIPALAFLLSLNISTAFAVECKSDEKVCGTGCIAKSLECKSCGGSCYYTQTSTGAVTFYGSGEAMSLTGYEWKNVGNNYGYYSGDTADTKHPFYNNSAITSVSFDASSNFTSIGEKAFSGMIGVTSLTIPDSVTSIGKRAFVGMKGVTNLTIPVSVTSIGDYAFQNMSGVTGSLTIPDSVTSIGEGTFHNMTSLTSLTIPDSVTSIGRSAFYNMTSLTSLTIPDSVTSIGEYAFSDMAKLSELVIPDSWADGGVTLNDKMFYHSCFASSSSNRPDECSAAAKIVCQGDKKTCQAALEKFGGTGNCTVDYCIDSSRIEKATNASQCTGGKTDGMYEWTGSACQRKGQDACNATSKYYFNSTNNQCQALPKTQSACTALTSGDENISWNSTTSTCSRAVPQTPVDSGDNSGGDEIGGASTGGDVSGDFNPADCYNNGQVPYGGKCVNEYPFAKKRWTPAEASKWLHDGNDNFVVITFKK